MIIIIIYLALYKIYKSALSTKIQYSYEYQKNIFYIRKNSSRTDSRLNININDKLPRTSKKD